MAGALGMAICPLSLMIWGVLPPCALGVPHSRDRNMPTGRVTWMRVRHRRPEVDGELG